jgi:hypothetical protein
MNGAFGTGANNRYGFGVGDYAGGNYLSYNAETVGAFIIKAGGGAVTIDANGIVISPGGGVINGIQWQTGVDIRGYWSGTSDELIAEVHSNNPARIDLMASHDDGGTYANIDLQTDNVGNTYILLEAKRSTDDHLVYIRPTYLEIGKDLHVTGSAGIGVTEPGYKLEVGSGTDPNVFVNDANAKLALGIITTFIARAGGNDYHITGSLTGDLTVVSTSGKKLLLGTGSTLGLAVSAGKIGIGTVGPTSPLQVIGLPVYANNAAAVSGGLTAGAFYRTNANPDPVCVVH